MDKVVSFLWAAIYKVSFQSLRIVFTITKVRLKGALVAIWHEGRILLVKKSYRERWSVPGGMVKKGETWKQAAVRETVEEVGLQIHEKDLMFIAEVTGDLGPCDRPHLFQVEVYDPVDIEIDGREIRIAEFVEPEEAVKRALDENLRYYLHNKIAVLEKSLKFMG
ncbi:NUDIX domain-containing protein [Desulfosarcina widdelii]|nr:NUDIX hydrolase [Desulfosarcina widdelii]